MYFILVVKRFSEILRDHLMVGCDSLKVVILVRIQVPQFDKLILRSMYD